jgi:hypothetical protein
MKRLLRYFLNLTTVLLALGVGATLLSSPVDITSDGVPALHWNQAGAQSSNDNLALLVWPMSETTRTLKATHVQGYENSTGIIVMTTPDDAKMSDEVVNHLKKAHQSSIRDKSWAAKLTQTLRQQAGVKFAWIDVRDSSRPRLDGPALNDKLKMTQAKVTETQVALKAYELETAVLTDQLEQQWSERLIRQSVEDTGTITVMRARAMQALRLRLAKASVTDSETRLEGLSEIENARLDYLSSLNSLLRDSSGASILPALETNSVYQSPMLSEPAPSDPAQL